MARHAAWVLTGALVALALTAAGLSLTAGASPVSPQADPVADLTPPAALARTQQADCVVQPLDESAACTQALLAEINYGLASESLAPIALPSDWASLSVPEQIFVIVDLE